MRPLSDAAIIDRVLGGDVEAFALLIARYRDRYARFALHMLGNRADAEEALQDAFVRAYGSLASCNDRERFGAWLFRILANRCKSSGSKRRRREQTFVQNDVAIAAAATDHPAIGQEWREEIERALNRLDSQQREAFLLKYVEELEYEEMSRMTGVGISALKMRVKRACERLREMLQEVSHVRIA